MSEYPKQTFAGHIDLKDNEYEECIFEKCNINEEDIKNCVFTNCTFNNCEISNVKIINSKITDSTFNKCKLIGIEWSKFECRFGFANKFNQCYMPYSVFVEIDIVKSNFIECNLTESYFEYVKAKGVSFSKSELKGVQFLKCNLSDCDFLEAKNYFFDIRENNCKNAKFSKEEVVYLLKTFGIKME